MQSAERQMTSIKDEMPIPLLLKGDSNGKLLVGQREVGYGTFRKPLDENIQFQSVLHGIDIQAQQEGDQHFVVIYEVSDFRTTCHYHIRIAVMDIKKLQQVLANLMNFIPSACTSRITIPWRLTTSISTIKMEVLDFLKTLT